MTPICGADLAFRRDASAAVVAWLDETVTPSVVRVRDAREWMPRPGAPLKPSVVTSELAAWALAHGCEVVCADQYYRDAAIEVLTASSLGWLDAPARPEQAYTVTRVMFRERRLDLGGVPPALLGKLRTQLLDTRGRARDGGGITIEHPRKAGHGDIVSALVLAVWALRPLTPGYSSPVGEPSRMATGGAMVTRGRADEASQWSDDPRETEPRRAARGRRWEPPR